MRKSLFNNRLRLPCKCTVRLRAFTMAELVVSIGVLLLMFSLAGQVFSLTMQSTGQALAFTEINQLLRIFEDTLREDLRHVEPGQSLILIQANPINAYWTDDGREADKASGDDDPSDGYPHLSDPARESNVKTAGGDLIPLAPRADLLMFFTARKGTSFVDPNVTANLQQVVYGHAILGEYVPDPASTSTPPDYLFLPGLDAFPVDASTKYPSLSRVSQVPARQWHLARRSALLVPTDVPPPNLGLPLGLADVDSLLMSEADAIGLYNLEQIVLTPGVTWPWYLPDAFDPGNPDLVPRSLLDMTPPAALAERLGHFFLPNCASFKVEWALDGRSEFVGGRLDGLTEVLWFDQALFNTSDPNVHPLSSLLSASDAANDAGDFPLSGRLLSLLDGQTVHPDGGVYSLSERFGLKGAPSWILGEDKSRQNLVVFGAARLNPGVNPGPGDDEVVPEDIFPGVLRITIDLYDDTRRLDRPIRHVMIIPVGT